MYFTRNNINNNNFSAITNKFLACLMGDRDSDVNVMMMRGVRNKNPRLQRTATAVSVSRS